MHLKFVCSCVYFKMKLRCLTGLYNRTQTAALWQAKLTYGTSAACILRPKQLYIKSRSMQGRKKSLIYCGSCTAAKAAISLAAAVHEPQYSRDSFSLHVLQHLVYCSASPVGVNAPQFESFYTCLTSYFVQNYFILSRLFYSVRN